MSPLNELSPIGRGFLTAAEDSRRTLRELTGPLFYGSEPWIDTAFTIGPTFLPTSACTALYVGAADPVIHNCTVITDFSKYDPAWLANPIMQQLCGVRIAHATNIDIDGLHVRGFPKDGIAAYGVRGGSMLRTSGEACNAIFNFGPDNDGSHDLLLQLAGWDTWGAPPLPGFEDDVNPSRVRPGTFAGGDGMSGLLVDSHVTAWFAGELFCGLKLANARGVTLLDVSTPTMMVESSVDVTVRRAMINKGLGTGPIVERGMCFQVSNGVRNLDVQDSTLLAAGNNWDGAQIWSGSQASFRNNVFSGFNGDTGGRQSVALNIGEGSTINADFETANIFHDQEFIILRS